MTPKNSLNLFKQARLATLMFPPSELLSIHTLCKNLCIQEVHYIKTIEKMEKLLNSRGLDLLLIYGEKSPISLEMLLKRLRYPNPKDSEVSRVFLNNNASLPIILFSSEPPLVKELNTSISEIYHCKLSLNLSFIQDMLLKAVTARLKNQASAVFN